MVKSWKTAASPLILASASPRRKELLEGLGLSFIVHPSQVDETIEETMTPEKVVKELAFRKASAVAMEREKGVVIGADTVVVLNNKILGKPKETQEAFDMLRALQGGIHEVYSGLCVMNASGSKVRSGNRKTRVRMKALSDQQIKDYIQTGEPDDKAGAYGIQGRGAVLIESIEGDYFNVVGIPLQLLAEYLEAFGIKIF